MECPRCSQASRVLESRHAADRSAVRRRRECSACGYRFTTYERREPEPLFVIKRDGDRERFDRTKLRAALLRAAHKRPVSATDVEDLVERIALAIETSGGELSAQRIAELCLEGLAELDRGAYMQFAGTLPSASAEFAGRDPAGSVRPTRESSKFPPSPAS
ncbi:MAG: transcriptional regulator NrdR [Solirubrobacterales bacterium]